MGQTSRFKKRSLMIWICPIRIDRPLGALPRLRGRRGRHPSGAPRTCRAIPKRRREQGNAAGVATPYGLASEATLQGWRPLRPRKRGNAPVRSQSAFSLVEVLASLFILTLSAVGITAAWRLAD